MSWTVSGARKLAKRGLARAFQTQSWTTCCPLATNLAAIDSSRIHGATLAKNLRHPGPSFAVSSNRWLSTAAPEEDYDFDEDKVISDVYRLHHNPTEPLTLRRLMSLGPPPPKKGEDGREWRETYKSKIIDSVQLLHREIPIRLARRIVDLEELPQQMQEHPSIAQLRHLLMKSFNEMYSFPLPQTLEEEEEYMNVQKKIRSSHVCMHTLIEQSLVQLSQVTEEVNEVLRRFYDSRIGIRMLVDQHLQSQRYKEGFNGIIQTYCVPSEAVRKVHDELSLSATEQGVPTPSLVIEGGSSGGVNGAAEADDIRFKYVPDHIELIVCEILKFSYMKTLQLHQKQSYVEDGSSAQGRSAAGVEGARKMAQSATSLPPIRVRVSGGESGVTIKISDQGGGCEWDEMESFWSFFPRNSHYDPVSSDIKKRIEDNWDKTAAGQFAFPISKIYARYFGGDLHILPLEGFGFDYYLHLPKLTEDSKVR